MDRLWAMQVFLRVAECGSFSRAAASLDLANASVTSCVRNLERHLGASLFNRNTRSLSLTEAGEQFLCESKQILLAVERAEDNVQAVVGDLRGSVRMEASIAIGHRLICPALSQFAARYPGLSVSVTLTNSANGMIENAIDVAIRARVEEADQVARPVYAGSYVVCGRPDVVAALPPHPAQLDPRLCLGLLGQGRGPMVWTLERPGEECVQLRPDGPLHFSSGSALIGAALQGGGLVRVLDICTDHHVANGELEIAYPDWQAGTRIFYAVTPKTRTMSAKVRVLIGFLQEVLDPQRRLPAWTTVQVA